MLNKKFILIAVLVSLLAISAVSAKDLNNDSNQQITTADNPDILKGPGNTTTRDNTLPDDWLDDRGGYGDYYYEEDEGINAKLEIIQSPVKYGDDNFTFRLYDLKNNNSLANVDLRVINTYDGKSADLITDSNGIVVYKIPFDYGIHGILVGLGSPQEEYAVSSFDYEKSIYCNLLFSYANISNIPATLKISQEGIYCNDAVLKVSLISVLNRPVANREVKITFSNGKSTRVTTNSKGIARYSIPFAPGTYSASASVVSNIDDAEPVKLSAIKIHKASATLTPSKLSTTYASGKNFQVRVVNSKTKKAIPNVKLALKVFTGKKYKTVTVKTDSKGIAKYSASTLTIGTHKIVANVKDTKHISAKSKTSSVKVSKAALRISAPEVTNHYKQSEYFRVTVKNKETGKAMSGVKVNIKVYTGNKYKIFTAKTNGNGIVSFSTKSLSKTAHKVTVNVGGNSKIKSASAKSSISIINLKLDTHFELKSIASILDTAGVLDHVSIEVKLVNSKGVALTGKYVSAQMKNVDLQRRLWDASDKETSQTSSDGSVYFILDKYSGYNSSNRYVEVTFNGDSYNNGCSQNFYF